MKNFNEKANYPFTYGDEDAYDIMFSDYVVELMKTKKFQSYITAVFFAFITLGSYAQPSSAIPPEYGEAANEMINQVAPNGAVGGVPQVPPIGEIQGKVPVPQANPPVPQVFTPAMPVEQQLLIAAQQAGRPVVMPGGMPPVGGPTDPPSFYLPGKPQGKVSRVVNTGLFTGAMGVICLNALWGEPVAVVMCAVGLTSVAYKLGKEVVVVIVKSKLI